MKTKRRDTGKEKLRRGGGEGTNLIHGRGKTKEPIPRQTKAWKAKSEEGQGRESERDKGANSQAKTKHRHDSLKIVYC